METQSDDNFDPWKLSLVGSFGSWVSDLLFYPIDTLATRIKASKIENHTMIQEFRYIQNAFHFFQSAFYQKNMKDHFAKLLDKQLINQYNLKLYFIRHESYKSLYRGIRTSFLTYFTPSLVYFAIYEGSMNYLKKKMKKDSQYRYLLPMLCSPLAESIAIFFYLPFDIVRTRLQLNSPDYQYNKVFQGIKDIVDQEGFMRLFKACPIYLATVFLQTTSTFVQYEFYRAKVIQYNLLNDKMLNNDENIGLSIFQSVYVSILCNILTSIIINPLEVLFTRYQIINEAKQKLSFMNIIKEIGKNEKYSILFTKGLGVRMLHTCGTGAIWIPMYEVVKIKYGCSLH